MKITDQPAQIVNQIKITSPPASTTLRFPIRHSLPPFLIHSSSICSPKAQASEAFS